MPRGLASRNADESFLKRARVTLTSTQMLALAASPVTLLTAPGPGKVLQLVDALVYNPATGTQYTESSINIVLEYTGGVDITAALEGTSGAVVSATGTPAVQRFTLANTATAVYALTINEGIQVLSPSGDFAAGTTPIDFILTYRVIDLVSPQSAAAASAFGTSVVAGA